MALIPVGRLQVATPETMALSIRAGTVATDAVDERIEGVAAEIIADSPTVIAAAEAAIDDAIEGRNLPAVDLTAGAARSIRTSIPMNFQDSAYGVRYPSVYPSVYPAGQWSTPVPRRADIPTLGADGKISRDVLPETPLGVLPGLVVQSVPGGPIDLEVRDGRTYIRDAVIGNGGGGDDGAPTVKRVVMVGVLGQSNQVSYAMPLVPLLDYESPRIWQMPAVGDTMIPAAIPLSGPGVAAGLSPAHVLAREIAAADPECVVVLVPSAVGGSGLVTDPNGGRGKWEITYTGPNPRLYADAVAQMERAIGQAVARWGLTPSVLATWVQGEADGGAFIPRATYAAALDALITDWRGKFGGLFFIAGIVPGYEPAQGRGEITLALQDTPRRMQYTAWVPGVDNGGGSRGPTDTNHYSREAVEKIGRDWFKAIPRASNNITGSPTNTPLVVTATRWAGTVTVSWTPPYCRVASYEVQSSTDGTTWVDVPVAEPAATTIEFASTVPVKVRVRAIGTDTSNWTAPVVAIGG